MISDEKSARYQNFKRTWPGDKYILAKFVNPKTDFKIKNNNKVNHVFDHLINNIPFNKHNFINRPLKSQIACSLAHMLIYDEIIKKDLQNILILEDDAEFICSDSVFNFNKILSLEFDILKLSTYYSEKDLSLLTHPVYGPGRFGTWAYVVKNKMIAQRILENQYCNLNTT